MENRNITTKIIVCSYEELTEAEKKLIDAAKEASNRSYAPYSRFQVGAAVRLAGGVLVSGSNQENAAYPSGTCAERTTLFYANSVILETEERYRYPIRIYLYGTDEVYIVESIRSLLPLCFGKSDLPE